MVIHSYNAMMFAKEAHKGQVRKYTGEPYHQHPGEVAGIIAPFFMGTSLLDIAVSVAWLHDVMEDCGVTYQTLVTRFCTIIADGVLTLSDLEVGLRKERKAMTIARLKKAPGWIQTIKCGDLISNTASIALHDKPFSEVYLPEKQDLLVNGLHRADNRAWLIAWDQCKEKW